MTGEVKTDEEGTKYQEVTPGAPDDPFRDKSANPSPAASEPDSKTPAEPAAKTGDDTEGKDTPTEPPPAAAKEEAPAAAPAEPAPESTAEADEFKGEEEKQAAIKKLDAFLEERATEKAEEVRRETQSASDKRAATLETQMKASQDATKQLKDELRELKISGLSEDEQKAMRKAWEAEDRTSDLDTYAKELDIYHKELVVTTLVKDYGDYGVTAKDLGEMENPEEMELFCVEAKAAFLEEKLKQQKGAPASADAAAASQPKPADKPAPAGAHAPSDAGGGGASPPPKEPRTDKGPEALEENLRGMEWQTVSKKE